MKFIVEIQAENINTLKFHLSKLVLHQKCEIVSITDEEENTEEFANPTDILRPDRSAAFVEVKQKRSDNARMKIEAMTEVELAKVAKGLGVKTNEIRAAQSREDLISLINPIIKL